MIMSQQGDYMSKKNLKDAHFLVPLENNTPSVVTSLMLISFSVLCLCRASMIFTKLPSLYISFK